LLCWSHPGMTWFEIVAARVGEVRSCSAVKPLAVRKAAKAALLGANTAK